MQSHHNYIENQINLMFSFQMNNGAFRKIEMSWV